ncbi:RidA family protein [Desulfopila sp. IMCC35006]|uniref:RidA family protein n=1 Tax=Desulfopila sp. IMCC35006 TaxID=2569542 RepID=UPI0010AD3781|nr:RidA family protein [Desulfopila sp. IMCC35006]TKB27165.1 RidA family protein [Desulfopila sp. IMCC35006]
MLKKVISTTQAPSAIGPYSQAIATESLLFISGQLPIDPVSGRMLDGDIGAKTRQIITNATAIAKEAGTDLSRVVKTTIFLTNLGDFQEVNSAYGSFFADSPPARSTVQVAALPLGANIEIEFILAI